MVSEAAFNDTSLVSMRFVNKIIYSSQFTRFQILLRCCGERAVSKFVLVSDTLVGMEEHKLKKSFVGSKWIDPRGYYLANTEHVGYKDAVLLCHKYFHQQL